MGIIVSMRTTLAKQREMVVVVKYWWLDVVEKHLCMHVCTHTEIVSPLSACRPACLPAQSDVVPYNTCQASR